MELLLGAGSSRDRRLVVNGRKAWTGLVTLDSNPDHGCDVVHDLNSTPWPFEDDVFDEVHAYEVLEHLGRQGDLPSFFAHFWEIYRILKPGGHLCATVPRWDSMWAWSDPGHTRVISEGTLAFLDQEQYKAQVGVTPMADYRSMWVGDFECKWTGRTPDTLRFTLQAVKPPRL